MVAIVTGNGLGLERSSGFVLGSRGMLGDASVGRLGSEVTVNGASGNLVIQNQDEMLFGLGPDDILSRTYNSLGLANDDNGDNWRESSQRTVVLTSGTVNTAGSTVTRTSWDGSNTVYTYDSSRGAYVAKEGSGSYDTISYATNVWTWTDGNSRMSESYDGLSGGRITASKDTDGNQLSFTYTGSLLTRVTTADGNHTDLSWTGNNLTQITTSYTDIPSGTTKTLTRTRYSYDASNRLSTVTTDLTPGDNSISDGNTDTTTYTYDSTSGNVASISETGSSNVVQFTYVLVGTQYRIATVTENASTSDARTTQLSYNTSTRVTTVTDPLGRVTTLAYDANNNLTQITYPPATSGATAQVVKYAYDANGNLISATDAGSKTISYSYDANGNLLEERDAAGNTIDRTFGSKNELLTESHYLVPDPDGSGSGTASSPVTTRYAYDAENHLRFVVSAEGDVTEYQYNSAGQVVSTLSYPANAYDVSSLVANASISEATLASWAAGLSDRSTVERTDTTYDFRGNVATVTSYTAATSAGVGLTSSTYSRTTYGYDQAGRLLSKSVAGIGTTAVYGYDGLGRMVSSTDLTNASTSFAINDGTRTVVTTLASGEVQTATYDASGELITLADSGTGVTAETTSYKYDKLGRLRITADSASNRDFTFYDDAGRKIGYMDKAGYLTEYRHDAANRLVATVAYANPLSSSAIASLYDSNGNPTTVTMASVLPTTSSSDRRTWTIYDNADRVIETIDGTGDATVYAYDGASRLIQTTRYANQIAAATVAGYATTPPAQNTLVLPTANVNSDQVVRDFYDGDGLLIGTLDGEGALSRNVYDEADRKIEVDRYASFTTVSLRASGTFAQLLASVTASANAADQHSYFVYDDQGNLRFTLERNARPTEFVYDNVGNPIRTVDYGASIATSSSYTLSYVQAQITSLNLATNAATRVSRSTYDSAGRRVYDINPEGYVTAYAYDALSRVVKQTQFANKFTTSGDQAASAMATWASSNANAADRITRHVYDVFGRLVYEVDCEGYVTEHQYDALDRAVKDLRYAASYTVTDSVTQASLATQIGTPSGAVTRSYAYDSVGNLVDSYDGVNARTHYLYNAFDQAYSVTEAYGSGDAAEVRSSFDTMGRLASRTTAYGTADAATTSYGYDGAGNLVTITDPRLNITTRTYDNVGNTLTETVPVDSTTSAVTSRQYDAFGNVVALTDPRGNTGYFYYDDLGRTTLQIDAEGYATETSYNIGDQPLTTKRYYVRTSGAAVGTKPSLTTNAKDEVTGFSYDKLDRLTAVTDAEGNSESYVLNAFGNRAYVTNKLGGVTLNVFDRRGLLTQETLAVGSTLSTGAVETGGNIVNSFTYDARGNRTKMVEASNLAEKRTTTYSYDGDNRLVSKTGDALTVINPTTMATSTVSAPTESYAYDLRGNLVRTIDANGAATFNYYDDNDRKIASINAVGTLSNWTYDLNGNVTAARVYAAAVALPSTPGGTAPAGSGAYRQTNYTYDKNNRQLTSSISGLTLGSYNGSQYTTATGAATTQTLYDAAGNVVTEIDGNGGRIFTYYDKNGHKIAQVDQSNYLTKWTLDDEGNALSETRYANAVSGTVTAAAIPTVTADGVNDRTTNFTYDRNGRRLTETRLNVTASTVSGNSVSTASSSATVTYTYNGLGEVLIKIEATGDSTTYGYDVAGRQTSMTGPSFTDYTGSVVHQQQVTSYNGLNNVTRTVQNGTRVTTNTYGAGGRLSTSTDATGFTTSYYYDACGRALATSYGRIKSDGTTAWDGKSTAYDAAGRITAQRTFSYLGGGNWISSGDTTEMFYNAYGDVIAKGTNAGGNLANAQEFADYDAAGRVWRTNFTDGVTKAYVYDANGNATLLLQSNGAVDLHSYADLNDMLDDSSGNVIQTISVFDARSQLTDTIQTQSNNAGANPVHASKVTDSGSGVQYFNSSASVGASEYAATGAAGTTSGTPGATSINTVASVTMTAIPYSTSGWSINGYTYTLNFPGSTVYGGGNVHVAKVDTNGNMTELYSGPPTQFSTKFSLTIAEAGYDNIVVYKDLPTGAGQKNLVTFNSNYSNSTWSSVIPAVLQFQAESPSATKLDLLVRAHGTTGPYQYVSTSRLVNSAGSTVAGWFIADPSASPFNGLAANSSWDLKYYATDDAGNTYNSQTAMLSVDGSGNPAISNVVARPIGGPGDASATWDGSYYTLLLSNMPVNAQTVTVYYRAVGSGAAFTQLAVNTAARGGAYGQAGWWSGRPPSSGGPYEFWVEPRDSSGNLIGGRSYGTFVGGGQPSALTQYAANPETVTFTPPSGHTVTMQQFRYFSGGVWSSWIQHSASGAWNYDASALVPSFYGSYSYPIQYETYNGSTMVSHADATLALGYNGQSVSGLTNSQGVAAKVLFAPQQPTAASITLYWRDQGSTGLFTPVQMPVSSGTAAWDVDAAGVRPASGSRTLEYYYDAYDSSGNLLPSTSGADHDQGTVTIQSDKYTTTIDSEIRWVIDTKSASQYLIHRQQSHNAFGEISSETDGRGNVTTLSYSTEGKLIKKVDPVIGVTGEDGKTANAAPIEQYYFDVSGRQVGQRDANGNLVTQSLLAGSGYGGTDATVLAEYHFDGTVTNGVDVFGDVRKSTDALGNVTTNVYDAEDRLIEVDHPQRAASSNSPNVQLKDYYGYDGLGQRIKHWNSQLGSSVVETTDYDTQGRVTSTKSLGGETTSYKYTYYGGSTIDTVGLGNFGGWRIDVASNGETNLSDEVHYHNIDTFGRLVWNCDMSGRYTAYEYNYAGELIHQVNTTSNYQVPVAGGQNIDFTYYANGYVASVTDNALHMKSTFEYDNDGNRTLETYNSTDANPIFYQNAVVTYDAGSRVIEFKDAKADIVYKYDAVGNRREVKSAYNDGVGGDPVTQDYWYKYDAANRFTLTMGTLSGSTISTGSAGVALTYDAAGERKTATYGSDGHTETYSYTADGYLENMSIAGVVRAKRTYDAMGRVTAYSEYDTDGTTVTTSRTTSYDGDSRVLTDVSDTRVKHTGDSGYDTVHSAQTYDYRQAASGGYTGVDQGVVSHIRAVQYVNGDTAHQTTTDTGFFYDWWDAAKQSSIRVNASDPTNRNSGSWAPGFSSLAYDANGHLATLTDTTAAGGARVVSYEDDAYGQVLVREEMDGTSLGPRQLYYYFDGNRVGDVGNNGQSPSQMDYAQTLARSGAGIVDPKGGFRAGKPVASADFDENYQPVNASYPGAAPATYTVQGGDTLASIAQATWGDASLWYLIADANGISAATALVAGQRLTIPNKVANIHDNAGTFRVYDPGEAIGDTLPTLPAEPAFPQPSHHNHCGVFGQILLVAVAVAVAIELPEVAPGVFGSGGILGGGIAAGAAAGAAGSVVSQGVGLATGIQDKFSFKGVALAAIAGGIGGGLQGTDLLKGAGAFMNGAARGVLGNIATQGVELATGLQHRFDWAGVAVGGVVGGTIGGLDLPGLGGELVSGTAGVIAGAATRSLLTGSDFGDNLMAALPDAIGNTIGNLAASSIASSNNGPRLGYGDVGTDNDLTDSGMTYGTGQTGAGDGAAVQPVAGQGGGQVGRSASSDSIGDAAQPGDIVVTARRDTLNAIHYVDAEGEYDYVDKLAQNAGLDTSEENQLFRAYALNDQIIAPLRSATSFVADLFPGTAIPKAGYQLYSGVDPITGQSVSRLGSGVALGANLLGVGLLAKAGAGVGVAAEGAPEFLTVFRGDRAGTSVFKSYAAREGGYAHSQSIIDSGNLDDLFAAHAADSTSPASPFISVTSDARVAQHFAGPDGVVYEFQIPANRVTPNPYNDFVVPAGPGGTLIPESELLVPNYIRPSEIVRPGR